MNTFRRARARRSALAGVVAAALVAACGAVGGPTPPPPPPQSNINLSRVVVAFAATTGAGTPASQSVRITANSGSALTGIAVGDIGYGPGATGWLLATVSGGVAPADVTVALATIAMPAGTYTALVPVTALNANNSPQNVQVTLVLAEALPAIMVGASDIHAACGAAGTDEATAELLDHIAGTVFTAGDNAGNGSLASYAGCYARTWGRHKSRTRPATGNHDYDTGSAAGFFAYFGAVVGDSGLGYYSYNLGGWHVVVLNSNIGVSDGGPQVGWLRADLAANRLPCTLAYWHHPRFSSGINHGSALFVNPLWTALYEFGAELVINGHEHLYERFAPQTPDGVADSAYGIREFIVGTAGTDSAALYPFHAIPLPNSEARQNWAPGVIKLTLSADHYAWQFVPIAGQTYADAGSGRCHGPRPAPVGSV